MNLSRKIILVIISTFIALVIIVAIASDIILLHSFTTLETKVLRDDVQKIRNEIDESIPELEASARNYVELLQKNSPQLIDRLTVNSFVNNRVDFVACYSATGKLLAARAADFHNRSTIEVNDEFLQSAGRAAEKALKLGAGRLQGCLAIGRKVSQHS